MFNLFLSGFEITQLTPILIIVGISVLCPILVTIFKLRFIPVPVFEIFIGILLSLFLKDTGVFEGTIMDGAYEVGMILLLFLSGLETDYSVLKKNIKGDGVNINPFKFAVILLLCVLGLSFGLSFAFSKYIIKDTFLGIYLIGICLSSTFASLVVPILHSVDAEHTTVGKVLATYATLSELLTILMLSIFMLVKGITEGYNPLWLILMLVVLVVATIFVKKVPIKFLSENKGKFVNAGVRCCIFIILGISIVSYISGVEVIFGAFLCGMLFKYAGLNEETEEKISIIGYSIFIPIFYTMVGYKINVEGIFSNPENLLTVLFIVLAMIAVRLPFLYLYKYYKKGTPIPSLFLSCCTIIVPLSIEHLNHSSGILEHEFVECLIFASAILIIISPIMFKINKKFNICRDEYKDIILEPGEAEPEAIE